MSQASDAWTIPTVMQPRPEAQGFDLDRALDAVVQLRSTIPADGFTAPMLGTERHGSAVLLDGGRLAVTIGYLVTEAEEIWLTSSQGAATQAHVLGYDFVSGFGLLLVLGDLRVAGLTIGSVADLAPGDPLILAASGGRRGAVQTRLLAKREFAGYWEYVLDEALYVGPAHPHWGGTACIGGDGRLVGIGSLLMQAEIGKDKNASANLVVPIDLLPPIIGDLRRNGRRSGPIRPWLGLYATTAGDRVVVTGLAPRGPAARAGIQEGDIVLGVAGHVPDDLADLWRRVWSLGAAGVSVPIVVQRDEERVTVDIESADRQAFLKQPRLH